MFVRAARSERFKMLFQAIAATPVLREAIGARLTERELTEDGIADRIHAARYTHRTTSRRRAKTVVAWLAWRGREHANLSQEAGND